MHPPATTSRLDAKTKERDDYFRKIKYDFETLFATPEGKRILEDLQKSCFINNTSFSTDSLEMAFNEGKRMICLHIMGMATPVPENTDKPKEAIK